jgi:two-component system chemotaxis response regulator CheB
MTVKVLVVDDSSFFRRRVSEIINADPSLEVIEVAKNGKEAVELTLKLKPDVITMDIEMPVMDGITAVREIMAQLPTPILMFSSLTHEGAQSTLDALEAGALDFLPKKFEDIARDREEAVLLLQQRVKAISRKRFFLKRPLVAPRSMTPATAPVRAEPQARSIPSRRDVVQPEVSARVAAPVRTFKRSGKSYQLMAIGTSTGGPVALQAVLTALPKSFPLPILLIQHMPATFTPAFAARLNTLCQISVKEAENGDILRPGCAYLAPGGMQMLVEGRPGSAKIRIIESNDPKINYKPCVDITFASAAKAYQDKVLAMVLTGMGADGRDGARMLSGYGSTIWAQDEETCVVYGMPQAVAKAGLATQQLPIDKFSQAIIAEVCNG